ncbi:PAS domain-containing protein [Herminiimonas fonticola]|uniref:PAS domain S-box-containing protein n=1 Tax=Herminiimonas fonticola TaxID=303380 RepID=A0A4R6G1L6_9BURK|nr:PAS domain S-box protein [Herminiimonas fonticola]RBA23502.1 PAS domain S-box protein [Herminiimonas fonticola]TDN88243.1 PAS domain S-box-containing protein [Herminiimonas fonticola]
MSNNTTGTTNLDLALSKAIVDQAPDAIIFADPAGMIKIWNSGAERIFGHEAADVIGGPLDIIIPERMLDAHNKGFDHAVSTGEMKYVNKVLTTRSMHKDGSQIYIDMSFGMVRDEAGKILGALAVARDITERFANDKAQRVRVAELEKALAEKSGT